ncbi:hypothetical protein ACWFZ6_06990 [Methylorubrum extorquens]
MTEMNEQVNSIVESDGNYSHIKELTAAIDSARTAVASLPTKYHIQGEDLAESSNKLAERKDSLYSFMRHVLDELNGIRENIGSLYHRSSHEINHPHEETRLLEAIEKADLRAAIIEAQEELVFKGLAMNRLEQRMAQVAELQSNLESFGSPLSFAARLEMAVSYVESSKSREHYKQWVRSFNSAVDNKDTAKTDAISEIRAELAGLQSQLESYRRQIEGYVHRRSDGSVKKLLFKLRSKIYSI